MSVVATCSVPLWIWTWRCLNTCQIWLDLTVLASPRVPEVWHLAGLGFLLKKKKKKRFTHHDMEAKYVLDLAPVLSGDDEYPAVPEDMSCSWLFVPELGYPCISVLCLGERVMTLQRVALGTVEPLGCSAVENANLDLLRLSSAFNLVSSIWTVWGKQIMRGLTQPSSNIDGLKPKKSHFWHECGYSRGVSCLCLWELEDALQSRDLLKPCLACHHHLGGCLFLLLTLSLSWKILGFMASPLTQG